MTPERGRATVRAVLTTERLAAMKQAIVEGDASAARALAQGVLDAGDSPLAAIEEGFSAGIHRVGELWEEGEYFLPELVQGAEAMKAAMAVLEPALRARNAGAAKGVVVIGTVHGDLHDIGKTLVGTLLGANGLEVHDLGADVPVARFVEVAKQTGAQVVAASALLTTTMAVQRELVTALAAAGLRAKVLVGGAATTAAWAKEIGATWAENAQRAVGVAQGLVA